MDYSCLAVSSGVLKLGIRGKALHCFAPTVASLKPIWLPYISSSPLPLEHMLTVASHLQLTETLVLCDGLGR